MHELRFYSKSPYINPLPAIASFCKNYWFCLGIIAAIGVLALGGCGYAGCFGSLSQAHGIAVITTTSCASALIVGISLEGLIFHYRKNKNASESKEKKIEPSPPLSLSENLGKKDLLIPSRQNKTIVDSKEEKIEAPLLEEVDKGENEGSKSSWVQTEKNFFGKAQWEAQEWSIKERENVETQTLPPFKEPGLKEGDLLIYLPQNLSFRNLSAKAPFIIPSKLSSKFKDAVSSGGWLVVRSFPPQDDTDFKEEPNDFRKPDIVEGMALTLIYSSLLDKPLPLTSCHKVVKVLENGTSKNKDVKNVYVSGNQFRSGTLTIKDKAPKEASRILVKNAIPASKKVSFWPF